MTDVLRELEELLVRRGLRVKALLGPPPQETTSSLLITNPVVPHLGESVVVRAGRLVDSSGLGLGDVPHAVDELVSRLDTPQEIASRIVSVCSGGLGLWGLGRWRV
ncbi:hypothetical protein [Actinomadura rupiterrae]|uniref:hypothetical protein n=1 Tax=Actinomadura rupiterrae TaxID=559627 RepID=UPI0020A2CA8D|nr:hypothetical protein [Actinomadura rupiterrae]MCP2339826.1 hypothetical protein [Actinomadura rupiterrae]